MTPILIIHGGAGTRATKREQDLHAALEFIVREAYKILEKGGKAIEAATRAAALLEDEPLFNAGLGSKLQSDGKIRMSAGLMDGSALRFSGVVNIERLQNPIHLARALNRADSRVLSGEGAKRYAKILELPFRSPYIPARVAEYEKAKKGKTGTIGAVALDAQGRIAAATSTGGRGMEMPGRVSDTPTVAGTYANAFAGISATGIGEQIVDFALCAKIATRVEDGMSLTNAFEKSFAEAKKRKYQFGAIGLGRDGSYAAMKTTRYMSWAVKKGSFEKIVP